MRPGGRLRGYGRAGATAAVHKINPAPDKNRQWLAQELGNCRDNPDFTAKTCRSRHPAKPMTICIFYPIQKNAACSAQTNNQSI